MRINVGQTVFTLRQNGSLASISNPDSALRVVPGATDGYPFSALVRERASGRFEWIRINAGYRGPCRLTPLPGGLRLTFAPLCYADGTRTSIRIVLELSSLGDALEVVPTLDAGRGTHEVLEFICFDGTPMDLDAPPHERVAVPDWGEGKIIHHPRTVDPQILWYGTYFRDGAHYYSYTGQDGLDLSYGWIAAYGRRNGLALALVNEHLLTLEFKLSRCQTGLGLGAVFFRLRNYGETIPFHEAAPLRLGRLLLIPLGGDWHAAADIYRREYARSFAAVVPPPGTGPARVEGLDVNLHYAILGAHGQTADSTLNMTFDDVVRRTRAFIHRYRIDPGRVVVWLYGIGSYGHDRTNPTQRPMLGTAGGRAGFVRMSRALKRLGVGSHLEYTHPWATQQNQPHYDAAMDTGKSHKMMGVVLHNALCLDYVATQDFYASRVFQPFRADGATDLFLDQATLCMGICQRAHHDHRTDTAGTLGAHARGTLRLTERLRSVFGPQTYIATESHNDLGARTMELAVSGDVYGARWAFGEPGVEVAPQINHYTFPHIMRMINHGPASSLPSIAVNGCNSMLSQLQADDPAIRRYLAFKLAIRRRGYGYPYGFRDTVGLVWNSRHLVVRVFLLPGKGVTVTYAATAAVEDQIRVDLTAHGGKGEWVVPIRLKPGEYGFKTRKMVNK